MSAQALAFQTVPEFFRGKSIFITGGSGFLGRVLIEKLLRSCPDLVEICLLMRTKKGKSPGERLSDVVDVPVGNFCFWEKSDLVAVGWVVFFVVV